MSVRKKVPALYALLMSLNFWFKVAFWFRLLHRVFRACMMHSCLQPWAAHVRLQRQHTHLSALIASCVSSRGINLFGTNHRCRLYLHARDQCMMCELFLCHLHHILIAVAARMRKKFFLGNVPCAGHLGYDGRKLCYGGIQAVKPCQNHVF